MSVQRITVNNQTADIEHPVETEEISSCDFAISDENYNSIAVFNNGHIKTKNFDSSQINHDNISFELFDELITTDDMQFVDTSTGNVDLSIDDNDGHAIVQFKNGHIKTKNFNSETAGIGSSFTKDSDNDFDISDEHNNAALVIKDGYPKTKKFNGEDIKRIVRNIERSDAYNNNGLYETVVVNIADYENNLMNVYANIYPTPQRHYTILISEGTYNVNTWFSSEQIVNSNDTHWRGVELLNYTKLLGVGRTEKIVLQWMNPNNATHYGYISTLNTHEWHELENITVKANNIRYAVHDDTWTSKDRYLRVKNCNFIVSGQTSRAWGAGTNGGYDGVFDHCKFIMEYYAPYESASTATYINPICLHDNYYNVGRDSRVVFKNCVFYNPYVNTMYYWPDSWEQVAYDSNYPQYDGNKADYAVGDYVNTPEDTGHSYKCIYANSQVPPCIKGRSACGFGYGAEGADGVLFASLEHCEFNTYYSASPKLERITGFGNKWGKEPILGRESDDKKTDIIDFRD